MSEKENEICENKLQSLKINSHSKVYIDVKDYSSIYSESYHPKYLFEDNNYYYCSEEISNEKEIYFSLEFNCYYFLEEVKIEYDEYYNDCIPKNCCILIKDNNNDQIFETNLTNKSKESLNTNIKINEIAKNVCFKFKGNFGGKYIIIYKIKLKGEILNDIS